MNEIYLSKDESKMIQAIAVMLMVYHHLFAFPERIMYPYCIDIDFDFFHFGTILSYEGRICISIFAFISGYGLLKKFQQVCLNENLLKYYRVIFNILLSFWKKYILVIVVFLVCGMYLGKLRLEPLELVKNVLSISCSYNAEWWYVNYYLRFLLVFPIIYSILSMSSNRYMLGGIISGGIIFFSVLVMINPEMENWTVYMSFGTGIIVAYLDLYKKISVRINKIISRRYSKALAGGLIIGSIFLIRCTIIPDTRYDYLIVGFWIYGIILVFQSCRISESIVGKLLKYIGKYSVYIWLTHTFFAYYFFQKYTYVFKYSALIFIACMTYSIIAGKIINFILNRIQMLCLKNKRNCYESNKKII